MNTSSTRYQKLEPLSITQRIYIALAALRFFSPMSYSKNCEKLGKAVDQGMTRPFSGMDFISFIKQPAELYPETLPEPERHLQRIDELLRSLARSGLLTDQGVGRSPLLGNHYYALYDYALYEATTIERAGALILARALGPSFLHWAYQAGTYQITGVTEDMEQHAGTGIAIASRWIMTCAHVVNDMKVHPHQGQPGREFNIVRQIPHDKVDVALIEVDRDLHVVQGLNFRDPHSAERVYTFGYPRIPLSVNAALVMQGGEVSAERVTSFFNEELFLFSAIARPGNSGGPILSEDGHVVGIVTKELSEDDPLKQPFHAGIPTSTIDRAIKELACAVALPIENWQ